MAKKVPSVLSGHGYWGEELIGPQEALEPAGYEIDFATPTGSRPQALTTGQKLVEVLDQGLRRYGW